ncbi:4'-phosphopantetheinyl transferase family protein [Desulfocucumis palustris]|nr:4'-phosphopantetheinyl transferase superfamily protein [Desulfocucumis palustris]
MAISLLTGEDNLKKILIQQGIFNQPVNCYYNTGNIQVSIAHSDELGAAIAFPEASPMGIDVEKIDPKKTEVLQSQITKEEFVLFKNLHLSCEKILTLLWSTKESLSKVLKTGLTIPFQIYEISAIEVYQNHVITYFKNFRQYRTVSFTLGRYICSISYPKLLDLKFDVQSMNFLFDSNQYDELVI